jgi:hypothetical protein
LALPGGHLDFARRSVPPPLHERLDLAERRGGVGEGESAALLDLAGGAQEGARAARASAEPRLIRRTPAAARSSTENCAREGP